MIIQNATRGGGATEDARRGKESQMTPQQLQMAGGGGGAGGPSGAGQPGYQLRQARGQSSKPREGMATGIVAMFSPLSLKNIIQTVIYLPEEHFSRFRLLCLYIYIYIFVNDCIQ